MAYFRSPRTTAERRANCDGDIVAVDCRRRILPDAWDDIPKRGNKGRCWKRHRRNQFKVVKV